MRTLILLLSLLALLLLPSLSLASPPVRISLFSLVHPRELTLSSPSGARAIARVGAQSFDLRLDSSVVTVRVKGQSRLTIESRLGGAREAETLAIGPGELEAAARGAPKRRLDGALEVTARAGALRVALTLPPETLALQSALCERVPEAGAEAVKAQCVACLSYILSHRGRHASDGFDLCDSTHCQRFAGRLDGPESVSAPVRGSFLAWRGAPLAAFYTADCGGKLESPGELWGAAGVPETDGARKEGPYRLGDDGWCGEGGRAEWVRVVPKELLLRAISRASGAPDAIGKKWSIGVVSSAESIVSEMFATDGARRVSAPVETVARMLRAELGRWPILGRRFSVEEAGASVRLHGVGRGHLAGMCQRGAAAMARAGKGWREILAYYYPGAELRSTGTELAK